MAVRKHIYFSGVKLTALLLFSTVYVVLAQTTGDGHHLKAKNRFSIAPTAGIYKNHPQHTTGTKGKAGFCASYKTELLIGRRRSLLVGLDYFSQGLTFKGYYVAPGHTYLFDKSFAYTHDITVHELHVPILIKNALNNEKNSRYTPYYMAGAGFRYILNSYYVITNDSTDDVMYDGKGNMNFEYSVFSQTSNGLFSGHGSSIAKKMNAFIIAGLGFQRNIRDTGKSVFFELTYKYGISRLHYTGYNNSNDLNIKDSFLLFNVGVRF